MNHYLITRFNIPIYVALTKQLKTIDVATDEVYLTERFRLFETYTVPSVKQQTCTDFKWLVLFSDRTPDIFKSRISAIQNQFPQFIPIYIAEGEDWAKTLEDRFFTPGFPYITSRVDNDDALALNFIEEVQFKCDENKALGKFALIFNDGCQFEDRSRYCNKYHFEFNHFSSLFVPASEPKYDTILNYSHMEIKKYVEIVEINTEKPMWLEVVHGTNVSNRVHISKKDIVSDCDYLFHFGIEVKVADSLGTSYVLLSKPRNFVRLFKQYGVVGFYEKAKEKLIKKLTR